MSLNRFAGRRALLCAVGCLLLGVIVVASRAISQVNSQRAASRSEAGVVAAAVEAQLYQASAAAEALAFLARQNGGTVPNFSRVAADMLNSYPAVDAFDIEPAGIVSDVVPRVGRERLIRLNVMTDAAHGSGAKAAVQKRGTVVSGPLLLPTAELGIVARVPVFQQTRDGREVLWGFVAASMKMSQVMLRARVADLPACGYNYLCYVPASGQRRALTVASNGAVTTVDADKRIRIPNGESNSEISLALQSRNGWVTGFVLEVLAVLLVSALVGLSINSLESRQSVESALSEANQQIARESSERQRAQNDMRTIKDAAAATHAREAEFDQAQAALKEAQQTIAELQTRLQTAARTEKETAANVLTRLQQDQAAIADLQAHLDAATRSARESAEASAQKIHELESTHQQAATKLAAAAHYETRVGELTAALLQAENEISRLRELLAAPPASEPGAATEAEPAAETSASPESEKPRSEKKRRSKAIAETTNDPAPPEIVETALPETVSVAPEPVEPSIAQPPDTAPTDTARSDINADETRPAEPEARPPAEPEADATASAPGPQPESSPDSKAIVAEKPAKPARKKKGRRVDQMDLFGGSASEDVEAPHVLAETPEESNPNETASLFGPESTDAKAEADTGNEKFEEPETTAPAEPALHADEKPDAVEMPAQAEAPETVAVADATDTKGHAKAMRHFVHEFSRTPEKIRDQLVQGDAEAAQKMAQALADAAEEAGAEQVSAGAGTLARAIQDQADPARTEFVWADLQKAMHELSADFKPAQKPKAEKPKSARSLPAPPPVEVGELRTAVGMITPLLMDQDPGAKDCLKDNRDTFRSTFSPEGYVEFEEALKGDHYGTALEHLRKATRKHGISI